MRYIDYHNSPLGILEVVCDNSSVITIKLTECIEPCIPNQITNQVKSELTEYFQGDRKVFNINTILVGTPFQKEIWQKLLKIPYGETISYSDFALLCCRPNSARAVASAIAKNPIPIIIPCHRVIQKDGSIGGFLWGTQSKRLLLSIENKGMTIK